jgi:hypothetical protein
MAALNIAPLGLVATGDPGWREREDDLRRLVDEVTQRFRVGRLLPLGLEPEFDFYRRYIPGGLPDPECYCAVGVLRAAADQGTPFWLRYHRESRYRPVNFQVVSQRILASRFGPEARGDGGHVWLPLRVSPDRGGASVVDQLAERIEEIRAVAAGAAVELA